MATVKLLSNYATSPELCQDFTRQCKTERQWDEITLTTDDRADYFLLINGPGEGTEDFDPARTILTHLEPPHAVATWGDWATPDPRLFLQIRRHDRYANIAEWHLEADWTSLSRASFAKTHTLSSITSSKNEDPGQRLRLQFLHFLEAHGQPIDIYGFSNDHSFSNYRGPLPNRDKRAGLAPYRYSFAAENSAHYNYFTEKLHDALLMECLPFYWGCPNIGDHIDARALIQLPLEDFAGSLELIKEAIAGDAWTERLPFIRAARRTILNRHQLLPVVARVVRGDRLAKSLSVKVINLDRRADRLQRFQATLHAQTSERFYTRVTRHAAVDGQQLSYTHRIRHLFRANDFSYRRAVIGCALSHLALWQQLAAEDAGHCLIFEDDIELCAGFEGQLIELCGLMATDHPQCDIVFLGYTSRDRMAHPPTDERCPGISLNRLNPADYVGGMFAYILSATAARKLLSLVETHGIPTAIDRFLQNRSHQLTVLCATPHLVTSACAQMDGTTDSDIQYDGARLP